MAAGLDEGLFWELTPPERRAVWEVVQRREQDHRHLFGLIAATVENTTPGKARRAKQPGDYFRSRRAGLPVTEEDRKRLAHRMAPTGSIRNR